MTDLQKPTVNLNGATRNELVREHMNCANALRTAAATLGGNRPHGRDYQTSRTPFESYNTARDAFHERITALRTMADEFEQMALVLHEEGNAHSKG